MDDTADDAESECLIRLRSDLINEADRLPAEPRHLVSKALVLAWIEFIDHHEVELSREDLGTNGRLALDIGAIARVPARPGRSDGCAD